MKQNEGNYTKIPNQVLEGLALSKLNGTQYKIIFAICRHTFGFHREAHKLSISFISKAIDGEPRNVRREINNLIDEKILQVTTEATFRSPRILAINEDVYTWCKNKPLGDTSPREGELTPSDRENSPSMREGELTPQEINKKNIKEKSSYPKKEDVDEYFNTVWNLYPRKKGKGKVTKKQKERIFDEVPLEKMVRIIERYKQEVKGRPEEFIMHGSTFFNSGYIDYLETVGNQPKVKAIPQPKEVKILDYEEKIRQLQEEEERRYQIR